MQYPPYVSVYVQPYGQVLFWPRVLLFGRQADISSKPTEGLLFGVKHGRSNFDMDCYRISFLFF